jgi:nucleoside-diphosphate-sugar epimerase
VSLSNQVIAVTGANGLIGSACCAALARSGATVRALVRDPAAHHELADDAHGGVFRFDLAGDLDEQSLRPPVRALIHCAYLIDDYGRGAADAINVGGTRRLMERCRRNGVAQFVFISSLAAHDQARSVYGKRKWRLENEMDPAWAATVKPGTVVGPGGVFARLRAIVRAAPILPVFYARHRIQTVFIDDLSAAIVQTVARSLTGRLIVAERAGIALADFYRGIAQLEGKRIRAVPFPGELALMLVRAAQALSIRPPITADNLLGIRHIRHADPQPSSALLGVSPRDYWSSLTELAKREGRALPSGKSGRAG